MKAYHFDAFGIDNLRLVDVPLPEPGPGEVRIAVRALSLNYRDLLVIQGLYSSRLTLPAVPLSDGAGVVTAVGEGVNRVKVGDEVISHFIADWIDGPFRGEYAFTTLGCPGTGMASEEVVLPAHAVVKKPAAFDFAQAATLPIAALTAWAGLVIEGRLGSGQWAMTLGTGGVSIFGLQIAKALGAHVAITSSRDAKLERARAMGADLTVNYETNERWERAVLDATQGRGVDVMLEIGGAGTLERSIRATRPGGTIAMIGVLAGGQADLSTVTFMMRRQRLQGILVESRGSFESMNAFLVERGIEPVIDQRFAFDELPLALRTMEEGLHFGKIVIEM